MASLADKVLNEAAGLPQATGTVNISVTAVTATDTLAASTLYRFVATQDMYINIEETDTAATSSHMLLLAGIPEVFKTSKTHIEVNALRVDTDGTLSMTPLASTPI